MNKITMKIELETANKLKRIGRMGESYNDLINRILDLHQIKEKEDLEKFEKQIKQLI